MGFVPPPYPHDRLKEIAGIAGAHVGGMVDLGLGNPGDEPPHELVKASIDFGLSRGYQPSKGSPDFREAAAAWLSKLVGVNISPECVAATIGSKEFVSGLPQWLKLRQPERDTVLYPAVSYPTYLMGATLANCRAVPVPLDNNWRLRLDLVDADDVARALCLWVNSPANPTGVVEDLDAVAAWGRSNGVLVVSDECYAAYTWKGPARSIVSTGIGGVLALHSLSKRSNFAGGRSGFYVGDPEIVDYLAELRKHAGYMQPGIIQSAAVGLLRDESHVEAQSLLYAERLKFLHDLMNSLGAETAMPEGGMFVWSKVAQGDDWTLVKDLAKRAGILASPGSFYGETASGYVRLAAVAPMQRLELAASRL